MYLIYVFHPYHYHFVISDDLQTVLSTLPKFKLPSSGSSTSAKPKPITINVVGSKADDLQLIQEEDVRCLCFQLIFYRRRV